jgi:pyruvate formate lyase activating enzyme
MGFLHSFTTGSTLDGPGVRAVAWLTGCQFRCLYCHNPDTWTLTNGIPLTLERAKQQLAKYANGLKTMKGGLTISGGEPLMQARFTARLLAAAKGMGIHTALDTNGALGTRLSDQDLASVDLVLLDIKAWSVELHRKLVSAEIAPVLEFATRLAHLHKPIWLRYVLVPGYSDAVSEVQGVAEFASRLGNVQRVDVLPFHQMGQYKWAPLGLEYRLGDTEPPSAELIRSTVQIFRTYGLNAY